ncbi:MAG TPA: hypothetical protein DEG76_04325 [Pseudohongiella sp.]|nr:hypothetical protein [Pseudohongiella sp.]|tara:strand:- start:140131 stop:141801 length:1671 start_codon:yes stop_codon:yes gene_type:complete
MNDRDIQTPKTTGRTTRRWLILLSGTLLLVIAAGAVIHQYQTEIANTLLDRALRNQPARITEMSGLNADTQHATIDSISVVLSEPAIELTLNQVELSYSWASLLARRVEAVRIDGIRATLLQGEDSLTEGTLQTGRVSVDCARTGICQVVADGGGSVNIEILLPGSPDPTPLQFDWTQPIRAGWVSASQFTASLSLQADSLALPSLPLQSMPVQLDLAVSRTGDELRIDASAHLPADRSLQINASHEISTGRGSGQFTTDGFVFTELFPLSALVSLPDETDIIAGQLAAQAQLTWLRPAVGEFELQGPIDVQAQNLSGYFDDTVFTRLGVYMKAELLPDWQLRTREPGSAALTAVDPGIELEYLSTRFTLDTRNASLQLIRPQATVFDGIVSAEQIDWQPDTPEHFEIQLQRIDVARILGLSAYQQVQATGRLDGNLPVGLLNTTAVINGGKVTSVPPGGSIRYQGARFGGSNQNMELVNQALQRYDYSSLDATINYSATGDLNLDISLQGISPLLNNGQRINLNLTIADNVPELLRSLQAGRSVQEALSDHLQRR